MVKLLRILAVLAVPMAIFAVIAATQRHLFLKVPKLGFVLYVIAGGSVPPYIDGSIFKRNDEWLKSGDVVISVPAKSGTTWMMFTLNLLRARGKLTDGFRDVYEEVPWIDMVYYPGQTVEDRIDHVKNVSRRYPYNLFKTHFAPPALPLREDVRYVVCFRNIFDAAASVRPFFHNHQSQFAKMWGGFPPGAGDDNLSPEEDWEHMMLTDGGDGKPLIKPFFFDLFTQWWPYRHRPNVLLVHYSDRVNDDLTQLRRISTFLGIKLTESELADITKQVSFEEMKKMETTVEARHIFDQYKAKGLVPNDVFLLNEKKGSTMLNKGATRKGDHEMTAKMRKGIEALIESELNPEQKRWYLNGGPIPE